MIRARGNNIPHLCDIPWVILIGFQKKIPKIMGACYIYIPGTQMTLVLIRKDLVLEGSRLKIEDKQIPGIYIYYPYITGERNRQKNSKIREGIGHSRQNFRNCLSEVWKRVPLLWHGFSGSLYTYSAISDHEIKVETFFFPTRCIIHQSLKVTLW